jgi:hypothetical protein
MKLRISRTLMVAAGALVFGSASYAQANNVRGRVPFDFVLDDKAYSAGQYEVQTAIDNTYVLSIRNIDGKKTRGLTVSHPCSSSKRTGPANQGKLEFHRVGNKYFLFRVWVGGSAVGREFPTSPGETQLAMNGLKTETVTVAANIVH